jgi:DNA repair protein RadC
MNEAPEKPHYLGHRKRLKSKFLKNLPGSFEDYEILEVLLFSSHNRKDVKPLAKKLLSEFGSLGAIINADKKLLKNVSGVNDNVLISLKLIKEIAGRFSKEKINKKPVIESWQSLINYCKIQMTDLQQEQLRILFLDKKHNLIADELQHQGTIENVEIDVRNILHKTIELCASGLILIHNHPSGDIKPSKADIQNTNRIAEGLKVINVKIYDHLIFGNNGNYCSFKSEGLI